MGGSFWVVLGVGVQWGFWTWVLLFFLAAVDREHTGVDVGLA